jgi:hypothetical protein
LGREGVKHLGSKYAAYLGCCRASSKEDCRRPPCPCNMDRWTSRELVELSKQDPSKAGDLLGAALSEVNWQELAEGKLQEVAEAQS